MQKDQRGNKEAVAAKNAEQDQSIEVFKQELADLKVKVAKKGEAIENMEKLDDQLSSELEQLENCNQCFTNECRRKDSLIDQQKSTLRNEKAKTKATEKCLLEIQNKNIMKQLVCVDSRWNQPEFRVFFTPGKVQNWKLVNLK